MSLKKRFLLFAACLFCLSFQLAGRCEQVRHFRVLAARYEPFVFSKDGELAGLDVDIVSMALKSTGCTYEIKEVEFSEIFDKLAKGEGDIAIGALYATPEREKKFLHSRPYFDSGLVLVSPAAKPVNFVKEMKGRKIGVKKGATGEKLIARLNADGYGITPLAFGTTEESFDALKSGRVDAVLNDYVGSIYLIHEKYFGDLVVSEDFFGPHLIESSRLVIYFRPALVGEAEKFDEALGLMEKTKLLDHLRKKWIPGITVGKSGMALKFLYLLAGLVLFLGFFIIVKRENLKRKTLKLSEQKYRELLENSPMAILLHDDGKLIFANATLYKMFGYKKGELPEGFQVVRLFAEGERARLNDFIKRREEGKEVPNNYETYGLKSNGTVFPIDASIALMDSPERKATIMVMKDISEQKRISMELQKSEERYRHIFEEIDHGIFISSKAGKTIVANPALIKMLGYDSFEDLLTRDIEKDGYLDPNERRRFQELVERDGVVHNFETVWLKKDGTPINVIESSNPVRDEAGHIVAYEGVVRDITLRKKAEDALRESEKYYKSLFEGAHDAIMVFEPEHEIILDANEQCLAMYGLRRDEFVGHSLEEFSKNVAYGKTKIKDVLRRGTIKNFNTVHLRKDGSEIILEVNASTINYRGKTAILSHARDITEKQKTEMAVMEKSRQLMALFKSAEAMGSFTDLKASATTLCQTVVDAFGLKMAWLGLVVPESIQVKVVASAGLDNGYTSRANVRWDESERAKGPTGRAIVTRASVIMSVEDPNFAPWREEAQRRGFTHTCSIPLIHEDSVRGALNLYAGNASAFTPERMETLEAFARHATMSIVTAALYEEAGKTIEDLLQTGIEKEKMASELERRLSDLEKSEKRFRSIVEKARTILLIFDCNGTVTYWNEHAAAFFGFGEDEILGKSLFDTIVPPTESTGRDLKSLLFAIIKETNRFASNINENIKKDGTRVWIAWTNRPILDQEGKVVEVLSVGMDITHLKRYENAIIKWEGLFGKILSGGCGIVYRRDLDLRITESSFNPEWSPDLKKNWQLVSSEMEREPGRSDFFSGVLNSQEPEVRTVEVNLEDGSRWIVVDAAQIIRDNAGEITYISGFWLKVS